MSVAVVVSPSYDETDVKNQDKVVFDSESEAAALCDGVTTSPEAAEAARILAESARTLFAPGQLGSICENLLAKREELLQRRIVLSPLQEPNRALFEEIVRHKRSISYQSTLVAVHWSKTPTELIVNWFSYGDSAFFAFTPSGELLRNNLGLTDENDTLLHGSRFTDVLPDCFNPERHQTFEAHLPVDAQILICSDGLYDCFDRFSELWRWLNTQKEVLLQPDSKQVHSLLQERHRVLAERCGSDDISLIWIAFDGKGPESVFLHDLFPLCPAAEPAEPTAETQVEPCCEPEAGNEPHCTR